MNTNQPTRIAISTVLVLGGCANSASPQPNPDVRRIALIPVAPPAKLYSENLTLALPLLPARIVQSIDNSRKSDVFDQELEGTRQAMGARLTAALLDELKDQGFAPSLLGHVNRSAIDPNGMDYQSLDTMDAVLQVGFSRVGIPSSRLSNGHEPQVNAWASLKVLADANDRLAEGRSYDIAESGGQASAWNVPADSKYCYPTFDALIAKTDEVNEACEGAISVVARRITEQLRAELLVGAPGDRDKSEEQ
jgi:hypothetical protein